MKSLPSILEFDWDKNNSSKSYIKHSITSKEAEEIFVSEDLLTREDPVHSVAEERYIAIGKTNEGKHLFVVFTYREEKVRIVSARRMHQKEINKYEKTKTNS